MKACSANGFENPKGTRHRPDVCEWRNNSARPRCLSVQAEWGRKDVTKVNEVHCVGEGRQTETHEGHRSSVRVLQNNLARLFLHKPKLL